MLQLKSLIHFNNLDFQKHFDDSNMYSFPRKYAPLKLENKKKKMLQQMWQQQKMDVSGPWEHLMEFFKLHLWEKKTQADT